MDFTLFAPGTEQAIEREKLSVEARNHGRSSFGSWIFALINPSWDLFFIITENWPLLMSFIILFIKENNFNFTSFFFFSHEVVSAQWKLLTECTYKERDECRQKLQRQQVTLELCPVHTNSHNRSFHLAHPKGWIWQVSEHYLEINLSIFISGHLKVHLQKQQELECFTVRDYNNTHVYWVQCTYSDGVSSWRHGH